MNKEVIEKKNFRKMLMKIKQSRPTFMDRLSQRLNLFFKDRNNPVLKNHLLTGGMKGLRAFSITGDIRIIYEETDSEIIFRDIGTHNQVY